MLDSGLTFLILKPVTVRLWHLHLEGERERDGVLLPWEIITPRCSKVRTERATQQKTLITT